MVIRSNDTRKEQKRNDECCPGGKNESSSGRRQAHGVPKREGKTV